MLANLLAHMLLSYHFGYIQCGFCISDLSIPGIAAHDRCNISHIFTFSVSFIYITAFGDDAKWGIMDGRRGAEIGEGGGVGLFNFRPFSWSPFLLVLDNWDLLWLLLVLSLSLFSLLLLWLLFSYTRNQYNYVITYYSFMLFIRGIFTFTLLILV